MNKITDEMQALCTARFNIIVAWKALAADAIKSGDYKTLTQLGDLIRSERECLHTKLGSIEGNINATAYATR